MQIAHCTTTRKLLYLDVWQAEVGYKNEDDAGDTVAILQEFLCLAVDASRRGKVLAEDFERRLGQEGQFLSHFLAVVSPQLLGCVVDGVPAVFVNHLEQQEGFLSWVYLEALA